MMRIGICDDEIQARQDLRMEVERILEARSTEYAVYDFSSGEGLIGWMGKHTGELDLVFLDIGMQGVNGMETAKILHSSEGGPLIAFVTGYDDYVFDGYTVGALGYVMKPLRGEQIEDVLLRAMGILLTSAEKVFVCRNPEGLYRVPKCSILYFFSDRRKVTCVTSNRRYSFYGRLDETEDAIGKGFVRIHQRYLVRALAVEKVEGSTVTIAGETLPVSRSYKQYALTAITRALLDQGGP